MEKKPDLKSYFGSQYKSTVDYSYSQLAQYLVHKETKKEYFDYHYKIDKAHYKEFCSIVTRIGAFLYSPENIETSIYREYDLADVCIMSEGSTRPIRIRLRHPGLPDDSAYMKTFYIKKNSSFNPRLIGSALYHKFSPHRFRLWVNDQIIVTSAIKGTVASRFPHNDMKRHLKDSTFLREMIRGNVLVKLLMIADMYPKNYIIRQYYAEDMTSRWDIIAIDFDRAFLPEKLDEAQMIVPDTRYPLSVENNLLPKAIAECFSSETVQILIRQEEERLAGVFFKNYGGLSLLFEILRGKKYSKHTFRTLNKELSELYPHAKDSSLLGDLLSNSFEYLLHRLGAFQGK